jgi:hypothetical protein
MKDDNEIVIINIDNDDIIKPIGINLADFPSGAVVSLKTKLEQIDMNIIINDSLLSPTNVTWLSHRCRINSLKNDLNLKISEIFLEFLVETFGDLYSFIKTQTKSFNMKKYLDSQSKEDYSFYKQVSETALFDMGITQLIDNYYNDNIDDKFFQKVTEFKSNLLYNNSNNNNNNTNSDEINKNKILKKSFKYLKMPKFDIKNSYSHKCIEFLTEQIQVCLLFLLTFRRSVSHIKDAVKKTLLLNFIDYNLTNQHSI